MGRALHLPRSLFHHKDLHRRSLLQKITLTLANILSRPLGSGHPQQRRQYLRPQHARLLITGPQQQQGLYQRDKDLRCGLPDGRRRRRDQGQLLRPGPRGKHQRGQEKEEEESYNKQEEEKSVQRRLALI